MSAGIQKTLFCPCGQQTPAVAGFCRRCYRARVHSQSYFSGNREAALERDGRRCRGCGAEERLHVHHRRPGQSAIELLLTVCAACHARLHRLAAIRKWTPEPLVTFWAELHPSVPIQLQFPLTESAADRVVAL